MKAYKKIALTLTLSLATSAPALAYDGGRFDGSLGKALGGAVGSLVGVELAAAKDETVTISRPVERDSAVAIPAKDIQGIKDRLAHQGDEDVFSEPGFSTTSLSPEMGSISALLEQLSSLIKQLTDIRDKALATLAEAKGSVEQSAMEIYGGADEYTNEGIATEPYAQVYDDSMQEIVFEPTPIIGDAFTFPSLNDLAPDEGFTQPISANHQESQEVVKPVVSDESVSSPGFSVNQSNTNSSHIVMTSDGAQEGTSVSQSTSNTKKTTISKNIGAADGLQFEVDPSWFDGEYLRAF